MSVPVRCASRRACTGGRGEVQAGHPSAQPCQGQGVGPNVALQMHAALPSQLAQPCTVEADDATEVFRIMNEPVETVVRGRGMNRCLARSPHIAF